MIAFYVSGHGFGHASRDIEVVDAMRRRRRDVPVIVRSAVPAWLFEASARRLNVQRFDTDSGVVQRDSLSIDEEETARQARRFYQDFDERVAAETGWLVAHDVKLVVADIPPLAVAAADRAGIPSVALANFTWDWIYRGLPGFETGAPDVLEIIAAAYARATHALRLPLHGGFAPMMPVVRDIPLVARRSLVGRAAARRALGLRDDKPIVLASFGGHDLRVSYEAVVAGGSLTLVLTAVDPAATAAAIPSAHVKCLSSHDLAQQQLRYEDLVAAADVVVSKPGYGIVSECIANDTALLYTSRGRLIEYDVMVAEMPRMLRCRFMTREDLLAGRWAEDVDRVLNQHRPPVTPLTNGAEVAAEFILATSGYRATRHDGRSYRR
jgi:L-arabinokinase